MHIIDRYAYANQIRRIDPAHKAGLALLVVVLCLALNSIAVGLVAAAWMWLLATHWAGLSGRVFGGVLLGEALFLALAVVGIALSVSLSRPPAPAWGWHVGPLWFGTSPESLALAVLLVSRALGCAAAMNFLALTTPLVDIIDLLRRLRVPALLIDLMTLMYRFIFILLESVQRMQRAQQSRLGYSTYRRSIHSAGQLGSRLFIDAYQRSQRLHIALQSRGYTEGELRVLPAAYQHDTHTLWLGAAVASSLVLAWLLL